MAGKLSIKQPNIILCEGADEYYFFLALLAAWIEEDERFDTIQVINFGGNEDLSNFLDVFPSLPKYDDIQSILIIRDAEGDCDAAVQSIQGTLSRNAAYGISPALHKVAYDTRGKRIAFSLFPSCSETPQKGTLEDLALALLTGDEVEKTLLQVEDFLSFLERSRNKKFVRIHKNKLHTYLSVNDKFVSFKIGEAANAGAFDFSNPKLQPLKTLILEMIQ